MAHFRVLTFAALFAVLVAASPRPSDLFPQKPDTSVVNQTNCNGRTYTYEGLAGYGFVASNARDKFGDTLGGYGSAIALDKNAWKKMGNGKYNGILYAVPDRGWWVNMNSHSRNFE